jgi:hypothetical protein
MFRFAQHARWVNTYGALAAGTLTTVFCLLLLAHDPLVFWNDDYEISILPVCADIARAWSQGEVPLLSPYSWVCGNLAGEFQYGTFSVFINALIVFIWKLPLVFFQQAAALSIAHLAVLSAGAFMLARGRNLSVASSTLVALIAPLNGWIICWGASDWFGALGAFAWLPWAWWAAERALDRSRSRWRFLWPAPFVYLLTTGGFPYTVLMLLLVLGWLVAREIFKTRELRIAIPLLIGVALGFGLAAPAWLALLDHVHGSARETLQPSSHFQWLVPWNAWTGLVLPSWTVKWTNFSSRLVAHSATELACGLIPVPVIMSAFFADGRAFLRKMKWEFALLIIVGLLAMIPTAGLFRWSFRWLPLFHLVLALIAAEGLRLTAEDAEIAEEKTERQLSASSALSAVNRPAFLLLVLVIVLVLAAKLFGLEREHLLPLGWMLLALAALWLISQQIGTALVREWSPPAIAFLALLATYLCISPNCGVPKYNFSQSMLNPGPLDRQRLYLSFYPPPEDAYRLEAHPSPVGQIVRPGSTSMWAGLRLINGYSPIRPVGVARDFATAIHGEIDPNMGEWLAWSEAGAGGLLDRLGVDGIIISTQFGFSPLPTSDWQLAFSNGEGRVYHRQGEPIARVRSVDWDGPHAIVRIRNIEDARNSVSARIEVSAGDEPGLIAFSRPYFRGYRAWLDRRELPVTTFRNLVPLVEVPARARGNLTLAYRPASVVYGGTIALGCAIFCITSFLIAAVRIRATQTRTPVATFL